MCDHDLRGLRPSLNLAIFLSSVFATTPHRLVSKGAVFGPYVEISELSSEFPGLGCGATGLHPGSQPTYGHAALEAPGVRSRCAKSPGSPPGTLPGASQRRRSAGAERRGGASSTGRVESPDGGRWRRISWEGSLELPWRLGRVSAIPTLPPWVTS